MLATVLNVFAGDLKRNLRSLTVTAALILGAVAVVLVAIGFGLSLLYVWLQQLFGTMPALAMIAGGCAVLALILSAVAFWRPARRPKPPVRAVAPSDFDVAQSAIASGQRTIDESIAALQQGSRESMLAAISLALVTGVILGRKL